MIGGVKEGGEIIWINNILQIAWICLASLVAMFAFASALQGYFADQCNWGERGVLILVCIAAFRPSLLTGWLGGSRIAVQIVAIALFAGLYFYQKRRRMPTEGLPEVA